jgi:TonB family protein
MEQDFNRLNNLGTDNEPKPDRSLWYMGIGLGLIILIMGYLTLFVDDVHSLFSTKEEVPAFIHDRNSDALIENSSMDDSEVRSSLIKFIEAFYTDQRKGYFDPPSYFTPITQTYYNYHNLTYQRLKDLHWKRLSDMRNFNLQWIVSSLEYERVGNLLIASYWTSVSYFQPSRNQDVSADIKIEMTVDEEGKILALRELEIKNLIETRRSYDTASYAQNQSDQTANTALSNPESQAVAEENEAVSDARYEGRLYDLGNVENAPEFQGGQNALARFLGSRLRYPPKARRKKTQGKVFISFIVEKNGSLTDFKVIRGIGNGCDEEAIRVLKLSPPWKPGYANGKPVRTSYTLPITFQLAD